MSKKKETEKPEKPREKTEFDKMWQKIFEEAEKPFKEKEEPPKKGGKK